jgi:uncharacterized protein YebE (UPF0316 family)
VDIFTSLYLDGWSFMFYSMSKIFCLLLCSCSAQISGEINNVQQIDNKYGMAKDVLALSFIEGCDYYKTNSLVIDSDFAKEERDKIVEGIRLWEDALGIDLNVTTANENCSVEDVIPNCIVKEEGYSITHYNADIDEFVLMDAYPQIVVYMQAFKDYNHNTNHLKDLIAHEVGHYLGLSHTWHGIMSISRKLTKNPVISEYDLTTYSETCLEN